MSYDPDKRTDPDAMTPQEQVALGALDALGPEDNTSEAVAEALTEAQPMLPPADRIPCPVSARSAGQYLGLLQGRGLARGYPPPGEAPRYPRKRRWYLTEAGRAKL